MAILLFSCTLALHARQVDIKLRLDYLWAAQARCALSAPWRGACGKGAPREGSQGSCLVTSWRAGGARSAGAGE